MSFGPRLGHPGYHGLIVCIVRANGDKSPKSLLHGSLDALGVQLSEDEWQRVQVLTGDVSQAMGLQRKPGSVLYL